MRGGGGVKMNNEMLYAKVLLFILIRLFFQEFRRNLDLL